MSISDVRVFPVKGESKIVAIASVVYYEMALKKIKVVSGKNGLFIGFPAVKGKNDSYDDVYFPLNKELRIKISEAIIAEYNKVKNNSDLPF